MALLCLANPYSQNLGGEDSPPNLVGELTKNTCFTELPGAHSLNLRGEIFTPQIWGSQGGGPKVGDRWGHPTDLSTVQPHNN